MPNLLEPFTFSTTSEAGAVAGVVVRTAARFPPGFGVEVADDPVVGTTAGTPVGFPSSPAVGIATKTTVGVAALTPCVYGLLAPPASPSSTFSLWILFETWPSWIAVPLQYPGYFATVTLVSPTTTVADVLSPLLPADWRWTTSIPTWTSLPTDALLFLQGIPRFLADVPWSALAAPVLFSEDLPSTKHWDLWTPPSPVQAYRFTDYSGVVFNTWFCSSPRALLPDTLQMRLPPISNLRAIHFLISSTRGVLLFTPLTLRTRAYG